MMMNQRWLDFKTDSHLPKAHIFDKVPSTLLFYGDALI